MNLSKQKNTNFLIYLLKNNISINVKKFKQVLKNKITIKSIHFILSIQTFGYLF